VIVETVEDGRTRALHYTVDTLSEVTILRSLVLAVNQKQPGAHVTLYVDCVSRGMVTTLRTMRDMFQKMAIPRLQVVSDCLANLAILRVWKPYRHPRGHQWLPAQLIRAISQGNARGICGEHCGTGTVFFVLSTCFRLSLSYQRYSVPILYKSITDAL